MIRPSEGLDSVITAIIIDPLESFFTHDLSCIIYAILILI
jgi:hypothetical protein